MYVAEAQPRWVAAPILLANETGQRWHDMVKAGKGYDAFIE